MSLHYSFDDPLFSPPQESGPELNISWSPYSGQNCALRVRRPSDAINFAVQPHYEGSSAVKVRGRYIGRTHIPDPDGNEMRISDREVSVGDLQKSFWLARWEQRRGLNSKQQAPPSVAPSPRRRHGSQPHQNGDDDSYDHQAVTRIHGPEYAGPRRGQDHSYCF